MTVPLHDGHDLMVEEECWLAQPRSQYIHVIIAVLAHLLAFSLRPFGIADVNLVFFSLIFDTAIFHGGSPLGLSLLTLCGSKRLRCLLDYGNLWSRSVREAGDIGCVGIFVGISSFLSMSNFSKNNLLGLLFEFCHPRQQSKEVLHSL